MARARNIKPGFFTNDELVELPYEVRLLFIGLWTIADKEGRLADRPKKIKMEIFPADDVDCDKALSLLAAGGFLRRYQVAGTGYVQIVNWDKHQNPHIKEAPSVIPAEFGAAPEIPVQAPEIPERAGLIADSLQSDPGLRIAESAPDAVADARAGAATELSIAMRKSGVRTQPADPRLIALAEQGVTPETVTAACEEAKRAKPNETIGLGYVAKILERWAADAANLRATGATPHARASPAGYQTPNDKAKSFADRLTGRAKNEQRHEIIDIN